ncbi:MAG: hypothetical protein V4492_06150 [Chlamydiota bacterium]
MAATAVYTEQPSQAVVAPYSAQYAYYFPQTINAHGFEPYQIDAHPLHASLGRIILDDVEILRLYHQNISSSRQDLYLLFIHEVKQSAPLLIRNETEAGIRYHLYRFLLCEEKAHIKERYDKQGIFPSDLTLVVNDLVCLVFPSGEIPSDFINQTQNYLIPEGLLIANTIGEWERAYIAQEADQRLQHGYQLTTRIASDLFQQFQAGYLKSAAIDCAIHSITNFITRSGNFFLADRIDKLLIQQIFSLDITDLSNPFDRLKAELYYYPEHAGTKIEALQHAEKIWYSTRIATAVETPVPVAATLLQPEDLACLSMKPSAPPMEENLPHSSPNPTPTTPPPIVLESTWPVIPTLVKSFPPVSYCDIRYQERFVNKGAQQIWDVLLDVQKRDVLRHVVTGRAIGTAEMAAMTLFPPSRWDRFSGGNKIEKMLKGYAQNPPTDYPWKLSTAFVEQGEKVLDQFYQGKEEYYPEFAKLHKTPEFYLFVYLQAKAAEVTMPVELPNWAEIHWNAPHMLEHSIIALERYLHSLPTTH